MKGQKQAQIDEVATLHTILAAGIVEDHSLAIDGGAHVGTWSAVLAQWFDRVLAFEPNPETYAFLVDNMAGLPVEPRCEALLDRRGPIRVYSPKPGKPLSGWRVAKDADGAGMATTIDRLRLKSCGLIKLDLEGCELLALQGAVKTIKRCRPVLVVEIGATKRSFPEQVHAFVLSFGYREWSRAGVDRIYVPEGAR